MKHKVLNRRINYIDFSALPKSLPRSLITKRTTYFKKRNRKLVTNDGQKTYFLDQVLEKVRPPTRR